jgi:hypothetical protein
VVKQTQRSSKQTLDSFTLTLHLILQTHFLVVLQLIMFHVLLQTLLAFMPTVHSLLQM